MDALKKYIQAKLVLTEPYETYRLRQLIKKAYNGTLTEAEAKELAEYFKPPRPNEKLEGKVVGVYLSTLDNKPIVDAEIKFTIAGEAKTIKTDETGLAKMSPKGIQKTVLTINAKGYEETKLKIN